LIGIDPSECYEQVDDDFELAYLVVEDVHRGRGDLDYKDDYDRHDESLSKFVCLGFVGEFLILSYSENDTVCA